MAAEKQLHAAIIKTLSYADIFDYPLNLGEIWKWLIADKNQSSVRMPKIKHAIPEIKDIDNDKEYFFLKNREKVIHIRKQRYQWSVEKLKIARRITLLLKYIPTVKLVGITGALSMNNTKKLDDIDLFIITTRNFLWTTRFLATVLTELTGKRRHPKDISASNKICLNMFVDEDHLSLPSEERDLFSAHEVLQMKPIWYKNHIYQKFLLSNKWVKKYLPNAFPKNIKYKIEKLSHWKIGTLLNTIEIFLKKFQLWYMKNHRTSEKISAGMIRFHPRDSREWILRDYQKRIKKYNLIVP